MRLCFHWLPMVALVLAACAPAAPAGPDTQGRQAGAAAPIGPKALTAAINEDPANFWDAITGGGGSGARQLGHLVNQYLVALGSDAAPQPRLLAELPSPERGTWNVLPDGRMVTTWKLRPGVVWHDGTGFTANDVIFSWHVNRDPDIPNGNQAAVKLIEGMEAPDPATVVVNWRQLYPFADRLEHREFFPLPSHLLERIYRESKDTLLLQPYFSREYIGLGPYRVTRWESGSHLDLTAFDGYFLGRPKIDSIRVQFIADENTALANLRAGALHTFLPTGSPEFEQMILLKREWEAARRGTVVTESVRWVFAEVQKGRHAQPADLVQPRVRQALLHAIDRPELTRAILGDLGVVADSWVHPQFPYFGAVRDALIHYPYDPARSSALLAEVGWRRGADGSLEKGSGERFSLTIRYRDNEKEATILRETWRAVGAAGELEFLPDHLLRDRAARANFTGVDVSSNPMGGLSAVRRFIGEAIPTAENRWTGTNRGSYSNPAWDEVGSKMRVTLEEPKRIEQERELVRLFSTELPTLPLYYEVQTVPVGGGLTGLLPTRGIAHTGHVMHTWNVHEWDIQPRS